MAYIIEAPCKINLHLSIGEKRPDGFHNLESLFASLDFSDTLSFERSSKGDCHLLGEGNLVFKAVSLFRERTGFRDGLSIRLDKRIPIGAGLGGGSSDAASTLLALNSLAGTALSIEELAEMAVFLGSDVPFFLTGGLAFVSGQGERIENLESASLGGLWVVLVMPPFPSDTASAYSLLDTAREREKTGGGGESKLEAPSKVALIRSLEEDPCVWPFWNDFLPVFLGSHCPQNPEEKAHAAAYRAILEGLREQGASFAGLSGAGSCCFGIFGVKAAAERAANALAGAGSGGQRNFVRLTFFLAHRPIR